jgi:hypothetical protein
MTDNTRHSERLAWEFHPPATPEPVRIEHAGISEQDAAHYLIGQNAIPHRTCACCGGKTPINGTRVRLLRAFGDTVVQGEWRTYPLAKAKGGN